MMKTYLFITCLTTWSLSLQAQTIRYVNHAATGANTGQNWQDAYTDLQLAMQTAQAGDEIWVAGGVYFPTTTTNRLATFEQPSGVGLFGGFAGNETNRSERNWTLHETVLSGDIGLPGDSTDNVFNVVYMFQPDSNTVLDGFTICYGQADSTDGAFGSYDRLICGGGLYIDAGTWDAYADVRHCVFRQNTATQLGGGGRTTELVTRPLMSLYYPQLTGLHQPLAGEYAGRREVLEQLPFVQGWGVEIAMLIDIARRYGPEAIAQVDLGVREHRHRSLHALSVQAAEVMATMLGRVPSGSLLPAEGGDRLRRADGSEVPLNLAERPPLATLLH